MTLRIEIATVLACLAAASFLAGKSQRANAADDGGSLKAGLQQAADAAPEDPAHGQLRVLREGLVAALKKNDLDAVLAYLDPDVVVTWQNGEVSRKPEGVRAYYERVLKGPGHVLESFTTHPTADELTHLYGATGVAFGSSLDHYKLTDGTEFDLPTRWSATVVKHDGAWRIASFHASVNMFDNPVLRMAVKRVATWAAVLAAVAGLIVGSVATRMLLRKSSSAGPPAGTA